jgi:trehalose 6-phosphate phosphatase
MPDMRQKDDSRKMQMTTKRMNRKPMDPMDIVAPPPAPDLRETAFLLDVDGTIVDIAPTPRDVRVPESLRRVLSRLVERTDGAVALVSGRSLDDLDRLFAPMRLTAVGGHGAEFRLSSGTMLEGRDAPPLDADLRRRLVAIAGGPILAEDKGYAVALHYRLAPEKENLVRQEVAKVCAEPWTVPLEILPGKAVVEIKHAEFTKATGVRELMTHPPFAGRHPIFIGDDTTDESVFAIMPELDGLAISVGRRVAGVANHFETPESVRRWLERVALSAKSVSP